MCVHRYNCRLGWCGEHPEEKEVDANNDVDDDDDDITFLLV